MSLRNTLVLFLVLSAITIARGATYFKLTNVFCDTNPKYFYNHTCYLKALSRYKSIAMMETWIVDKLRNTTVNLAGYVRNSANVYKPFVMNATVNVCQLLKSRNQGPYGVLLHNLFAAFTNVNHTCPFEGILTATNAYMISSHLPVTLPENSYKWIFTFYEDYPIYNIGHADFYLEFLEDKRRIT